MPRDLNQVKGCDGEYRETLIYGNIIIPLETVMRGCVLFRKGEIVYVGSREGLPLSAKESRKDYARTVLDFGDCYVSPGFIDLHVHGALGADFVDGTEEGLRKILAYHAQGGTTLMLATLIPIGYRDLVRRIRLLAREARSQKTGENWGSGAALHGIHLEGPFINKDKKGALEEQHLLRPEINLLAELKQASGGMLKMITVAPELEGAEALIKNASKNGIIVSAGHTVAGEGTLRQAQAWGLKNVTHFYNAMEGFHHRNPGTVGGALIVDGLNLDMVAEENHVSCGAWRLAWKIKGPAGVCMITDCTSAGGMEDGHIKLGSQEVILTKGIARLKDGTLAGSGIMMIEGIHYLVQKVGLSIEEAVGTATLNPARLLGIETQKGFLRTGSDADITVFDEDYRVIRTIVRGRTVYARRN